MSKYIPFDGIVLVRIIKAEPETKSGIVLPSSHISRYVEYQILNIGPDVSWKDQIKVGDIVLGNPTNDEEIEPGIKLINSRDIFAKKEEVKAQA